MKYALLLLFNLVLFSMNQAFADGMESGGGDPKGVEARSVCTTRSVAGTSGQPPSLIKTCSIECSQGFESIDCGENEVCDCECRSSGLPGCSCHPSGGEASVGQSGCVRLSSVHNKNMLINSCNACKTVRLITTNAQSRSVLYDENVPANGAKDFIPQCAECNWPCGGPDCCTFRCNTLVTEIVSEDDCGGGKGTCWDQIHKQWLSAGQELCYKGDKFKCTKGGQIVGTGESCNGPSN